MSSMQAILPLADIEFQMRQVYMYVVNEIKRPFVLLVLEKHRDTLDNNKNI